MGDKMEFEQNRKHILYLSRRDVEDIGPNFSEVIAIVEKSLLEKGKGNSLMHPKHWYDWGSDRFFAAQSAYTPFFKVAGVKWQSGVPDNPQKGLPYLNGFIIINNLDNGLPIAIMDSTWITNIRTAAQTAVTAKYLAKENSETLAMIGCGVQGRGNLNALLLVLPNLKRVQAFDINQANLEAYVEFVKKLGVEAVPCKNQKESITGADIIITAGPIHKDPSPDIKSLWLKEGVLAVPLDYDSYWNREAINSFDKFFVDDIQQILFHRKEGGFFREIPEINADFGEVLAGQKQGRESQSEKIMCMNLGVAVEDAPVAADIFNRAIEKGIGVWLPK
jgi:ornithine cyclodeaminase/alanine dehydrogenase